MVNFTKGATLEPHTKAKQYKRLSVKNLRSINQSQAFELDQVYEVLNQLPIGITITTDLSCQVIRHNHQAAVFLRITAWERLPYKVTPNRVLKISADGRELMPEEMLIKRAIWNGEECKGEELEFLWDDGVRKFGLWTVSPMRGANGTIIGAIATCQDITQRKFMEEEIARAHEGRYERMVHYMRNGCALHKVVFDEKENPIGLEYMAVNSLAAQYIGYPAEEIIGKRVDDVFPLMKQEEFDWVQTYIEVALTGVSTSFIQYFEQQNRWYHITAYSPQSGQVVVMSEDVSELKRIEGEMARLDRLNLIGEMAASIAHEVRNPLTTVRGYLQLFGNRERYADHKGQFDTMIGELDRANFIITEFLSLAKNKTLELKLGNLNDLVTDLYPLIQSDALLTGHLVHLELNNTMDIMLDEKEIRQLLLNLVRNGQEATSFGGRIMIKIYQADKEVILSVQDDGHGITEDILAKLGTPFVTTKNNGTGLGLPVCYRIAERHSANIKVETSTSGTTFKVRFPIPK